MTFLEFQCELVKFQPLPPPLEGGVAIEGQHILDQMLYTTIPSGLKGFKAISGNWHLYSTEVHVQLITESSGNTRVTSHV